MTLWRYSAIPHGSGRERVSGELAGDTAAEVRSSLRRIGLQVVSLRPVRRAARAKQDGARPWLQAPRALERWWGRSLRERRRQDRAELFDGLATMLNTGVPGLEALETMLASARTRSRRTMLVQLREALRSGESLGEGMSQHPTWFDTSEVAMVEAGQVGGTLPEVLARLSERHERAGAIGQKLAGALAYPMVVAVAGLGVLLFLSTQTLPQLVQILDAADVEIPRLTARVMAVGAFLMHGWPLIIAGMIVAPLIVAVVRGAMVRYGVESPFARVWPPRVFRRLAVAAIARQLAELVSAGIPVVEALRVIAPTMGGRHLGELVRGIADRVERGEDLSAALGDTRWFDEEFRRLLEVGQASGELAPILERIAQRYERQGRRLIDRLTALLEPAVIIVLAALVGTVVMAAVLPLLRIQEVV